MGKKLTNQDYTFIYDFIYCNVKVDLLYDKNHGEYNFEKVSDFYGYEESYLLATIHNVLHKMGNVSEPKLFSVLQDNIDNSILIESREEFVSKLLELFKSITSFEEINKILPVFDYYLNSANSLEALLNTSVVCFCLMRAVLIAEKRKDLDNLNLEKCFAKAKALIEEDNDDFPTFISLYIGFDLLKNFSKAKPITIHIKNNKKEFEKATRFL